MIKAKVVGAGGSEDDGMFLLRVQAKGKPVPRQRRDKVPGSTKHGSPRRVVRYTGRADASRPPGRYGQSGWPGARKACRNRRGLPAGQEAAFRSGTVSRVTGSNHHSKPDVRVPIARIVPVPSRAADAPREVVERAASQYVATFLSNRTDRTPDVCFVIVTVLTPFPQCPLQPIQLPRMYLFLMLIDLVLKTVSRRGPGP